MDIKKKIAKRVTITFLLIMILVTFSSKTIIYFTTPKVVTVKVQGGQISNDQLITDVSFNYSEISSIKFDKQYSMPLKVSKINCKEGNIVNSGDTLITFDIKALSDAIAQAQTDLDRAKQDLADFKKDFTRNLEDQMADINDKSEQIIDLQRSINSNKNAGTISNTGTLATDEQTETIQDTEADERQLEKLKRELARMQEDYNSMKSSGKYNGTSEAEKQKEVNKNQQEIDDLNNLNNNYSTIKAPIDCTITKIYVQEGDDYNGLNPIIDYRTSDTPTKIIATLTDDVYNNLKDYVITNPNCKVVIYGVEEDGKIESIEKKNDKNYMYINMKSFDKLKNVNSENVNVKVQRKSKNYNALVPNEAIFQDSYVYTINETTGFLGKELIVKKVQVKKGEYNSKYTGVDDGLYGNETIVKGTDREINDGQRVMINNKVAEQ